MKLQEVLKALASAALKSNAEAGSEVKKLVRAEEATESLKEAMAEADYRFHMKNFILQLTTDVLVKVNPPNLSDLLCEAVDEYIAIQSEEVQNDEDFIGMVTTAGSLILETVTENAEVVHTPTQEIQ